MRKFQRLVNGLASPCVDVCMVFDNISRNYRTGSSLVSVRLVAA
jgi:hypothetical protein